MTPYSKNAGPTTLTESSYKISNKHVHTQSPPLAIWWKECAVLLRGRDGGGDYEKQNWAEWLEKVVTHTHIYIQLKYQMERKMEEQE